MKVNEKKKKKYKIKKRIVKSLGNKINMYLTWGGKNCYVIYFLGGKESVYLFSLPISNNDYIKNLKQQIKINFLHISSRNL